MGVIVWRWYNSNVQSNKVDHWWKLEGRKDKKAANVPHKNKNSRNDGTKIKTTSVRYSIQPDPLETAMSETLRLSGFCRGDFFGSFGWTEYLTRCLLLSLRWRHNGRYTVSNHQPRDCLLNRLFRRRSKKTSKPRVTGLCAVNSPWTGEFPAQMASNAENVSIWWRHHVFFWVASLAAVWLPQCLWSNPKRHSLNITLAS